MPVEPASKRAITFFDGQNLYHSAKAAFGYTYPNYDVQALSEVADEIRIISSEQNRWIKVASAFPVSPVIPRQRGINKTDWIRIDRALYDACLDPRDYR